MVAVTAGIARFVKRDAANNVVTGTESRSFQLADLDNTASPKVILNDPYSAAKDDILAPYEVRFDGRRDELLCLQVNPDASLVKDPADGSVLIAIKEFIMDRSGRWVGTRRSLRLADRITPSGGAGVTHPRGLADAGTLPAGDFSDYLRFAPGPNVYWVLEGHARADAHNTV